MPADLPNGFSQRSADWWLPDVAHDSEAPAMKRYRKFVDSLLEGTGFELSVPLLRGSSGRCQSETAARKAEPLKGSGPRRRCLPGAAPAGFPFAVGPRVRI